MSNVIDPLQNQQGKIKHILKQIEEDRSTIMDLLRKQLDLSLPFNNRPKGLWIPVVKVQSDSDLLTSVHKSDLLKIAL